MMVISMMLLLIGMPTIIVSGIISGLIIPSTSTSTSMGAPADLWGHFENDSASRSALAQNGSLLASSGHSIRTKDSTSSAWTRVFC
jgi:hypothetical protein